MEIRNRQTQKIAELGNLLNSEQITQNQHDIALKLSKSFKPWYWKRNDKGNITDIVDIFGDLEKERTEKKSKKRGKSQEK